MSPEVRMNGNAGNLNFSLRHPAVEQLSLNLRRGYEIAVDFRANPCIMSIIIGYNGTQRHIGAEPFQTRDHSTWNEMGAHDDIGSELSDHVLGACIEHSVKRQCGEPIEGFLMTIHIPDQSRASCDRLPVGRNDQWSDFRVQEASKLKNLGLYARRQLAQAAGKCVSSLRMACTEPFR